MNRRAALAALLGAALAGCSTRDAANPLDPENLDTRGNPDWVRAVADAGAVDLDWGVPYYDDVDSVRVVDATDERVLWSGRNGRGSFREAPVPDGVLRAYRVDLDLRDGRTLEVLQEPAEPGPGVPWLLDDASGQVRRISPDGRHARFTLPFFDATRIGVDEAGSVLAVDFFRSTVSLYDAGGDRMWEDDSTFFRPLAVLPDGDSGWWVGDPGRGEIVRLSPQGRVLGRQDGLGFVVDLAPAGNGGVWVADQDGRVLSVRLGPGLETSYSDVGSPEALAPAPGGGVWVSDLERARLILLDASGGVILDAPGRPGLVFLAADPRDEGSVWAADRGRRRVVLVDPGGNDVLSLTGYPSPATVAVSPDGAEVWVADPVLSQLVRSTRDGIVLVRNRTLGSPLDIAVAFDPTP